MTTHVDLRAGYSVAQTMLTMLADSAVSDVHLVVEDIDVPAHKAVLGEGIWMPGRNEKRTSKYFEG